VRLEIVVCDLGGESEIGQPTKHYIIVVGDEGEVEVDLCAEHAAPILDLIRRVAGEPAPEPEPAPELQSEPEPVPEPAPKRAKKSAPRKTAAKKTAAKGRGRRGSGVTSFSEIEKLKKEYRSES
jgi:hypothetical protein